MAKESNANDYELDIGLYEYATTGSCAACHPGGGALEYDRQGNRYDDYLADGNVPAVRNGDYYYLNSGTGMLEAAPWADSGVLEIDCLLCHLNGYSTTARTAELTAARLRAAPTAGAGLGTVVDNDRVDYDPNLATNGIDIHVTDEGYAANCNLCHGYDDVTGFFTSTPPIMIPKSDIRKRGLVWGDVAGVPAGYERDVHDAAGMTCLDCHDASIDHQITKGNARASTVRDDLDFTVTSCEDCHFGGSAPDPTTAHDAAGFSGVYSFHFGRINCTACHVAYKDTFAFRTVDIASGQMTNVAGTQTINGVYGLPVGIAPGGSPPNPATWTGFSPAYQWWKSSDGKYKLFPMNMLSALIWNETDELTHPYFIRYVLAAGGIVLGQGQIADDNGDGFYEINKTQEIADMRQALLDVNAGVGDPQMTNPYLVLSSHFFSITHNVRPADDALGSGGCTDCHDNAVTGTADRWFFDGDFMLLHFEMENPGTSPFLASHLEITKRDGTHEEVDIDFSQPGHNFIKNWQLMGYTQAQHDQLVTPR